MEYGRREGKERFRDSARREWDKPGFRPREDRRREEDDRRSFRPRRAEDGTEFTRERKQAFNREEPKRFSRNEESDKLARIPANLRYMHRRRKPEEEN